MSNNPFTINGQTLTDKDAFIDGWRKAGGYMDDLACPAPWCCPWYSCESLTLPGNTPEEWGAAYWEQCRPEVERLLAEEAALAEDAEDAAHA